MVTMEEYCPCRWGRIILGVAFILAVTFLLLHFFKTPQAHSLATPRNVHPTPTKAVYGPFKPTTEPQTMYDEINRDREAVGVPRVNWNYQLANSAKKKACDMKDKDYFSHNSPDGTTPWELMIREGYSYSFAAENLAYGYENAAITERFFMESPDHRENILNPKFLEVGTAQCGLYYVQHFGARWKT
jgi:uncharacterized protein YkwD